ncbi:MAG TPA: DUF1697 domain-containing protein [Gemmataceae bacterium]|nr:DUF1697 domain-containing protein [Gemmataceae bacterium]
MALVVFLRGVNVGGHKTFSPSALAKQLANLDVVNIGAAGTFVVRKSVTPAALKSEICGKLKFEPEMIVCRERAVLGLAAAQPFGDGAKEEGITRYISILAKRPRALPELPLLKPEGNDWQVKVFAIQDCFALSLHRRQGKTLVYPNEVVEKKLGVSATTRNWNTIETICGVLRKE